MKDLFPGYYRPTQAEFQEYWESATFVFDTNVLLNLYRYSAETRDELFKILDKLEDRIWIPYQVAQEFHRHKNEEIEKKIKTSEKIAAIFQGAEDSIRQELGRNHPFIDIEKTNKLVSQALSKLSRRLRTEWKKPRESYLQFLTDDPIAERLANLFAGKVGAPYDSDRLDEIFLEGEERYKSRIPPGYKETKQGVEKYGDLVLWFQIIDFACTVSRPIVFITDDAKEDWWKETRGMTIGPRPELVAEMRTRANVSYYAYSSSSFMVYASQYLKSEVNDVALHEIQEIETQDREASGLSNEPNSPGLPVGFETNNSPNASTLYYPGDSFPLPASVLIEQRLEEIDRKRRQIDELFDRHQRLRDLAEHPQRLNEMMDRAEKARTFINQTAQQNPLLRSLLTPPTQIPPASIDTGQIDGTDDNS